MTQRVTDCFVLETDLLCIGSSVIPADPVFNRASPAPTIGELFAVTRPIEIDDLPKIDEFHWQDNQQLRGINFSDNGGRH